MTADDMEAMLYDWECELALDRQKQDVPFCDRVLRERYRAGARVAVLGCGTGRVALPLALAGWKVTGLDISEGRLKRARKRDSQAMVRWIHGDMTESLTIPPQSAVVLPYSCFLLLDPPDRLRCLKAARNALAEAGILIVDVSPNFPNRQESRRKLTLQGWSDELNARIRYFETLRQCNRHPVTLIGRRYRFECGQRAISDQMFIEKWHHLSVAEMKQIAESAGLAIHAIFTDYRGTLIGQQPAKASKNIFLMTAP